MSGQNVIAEKPQMVKARLPGPHGSLKFAFLESPSLLSGIEYNQAGASRNLNTFLVTHRISWPGLLSYLRGGG